MRTPAKAACTVLLTLLVGCGTDVASGAAANSTDCPNLATDWATTSVPSEEQTVGWVGGVQFELRRDVEAVRAYGARHPDEFAGVWFANEPSVRVVAAFTSDLVEHCVALRDLVDRPSQLQLVERRHSVAERARVRAEIESQMTPGGPIVEISDGPDHVIIRVRADGEQLAAQLWERYGDAVRLWVGHAPYPPSEVPTASAACAVDFDEWPAGVSATLELADGGIASGADTRGTVTITNRSNERFVIEAGEPEVGIVFRPGETTPVGIFSSPIGGVGRGINLAPGQRTSLDVVVGTAACDPTDGYALPVGDYEVRAVIGGTPAPTLLSEPAPLRITGDTATSLTR